MGSAVILLPRRPKSDNAKGRHQYRTQLATAARAVVSEPLSHRRLYCTILYFHRGPTGIDADNLSKPILDALRGVVYDDDSQVVSRSVDKIDIDSDSYELADELSARQSDLIDLLARPEVRHVLYIEVGEIRTFRLGVNRHLRT